MIKVGDKLYACVQNSEDDLISDIDFLEELVENDSVAFYSTEKEMLEDENYDNKCFVFTVSDYGVISSNPKYVSGAKVKETVKTKSKK